MANIYLHYFDLKWEMCYKQLCKLIRYCDDFVIICRTKKEVEHALKAVKSIIERLELELHPDKIKLVSMWNGNEGFDFLGFHHRRKVPETSKGQKFNETNQFPSRKAMPKMRNNIKSAFASRATLLLDMQKIIEILNPKIIGMRNYYGLKNAGKQLNKIDWYIIKRFTLWYNYKAQNKRWFAGISKVCKVICENGLQKLAV